MAVLTVTLTLAIGGIVVAAPADAVSLVPILGSGSTSSQAAVDRWRQDVARDSGLTASYSGTGSSAGRNDFATGSTDFAVTDLPFDSAAEGALAIPAPARGFAYVPAVAGATSLIYNLRVGGTRLTDLRLGGDTVAGIFTGAITNWADPRIRADNPGLVLPDLAIVPVVRADSSGSTSQFTSWMSARYAGAWNAFCASLGRTPCGPTSLYPLFGNATARSGSLGVAGYVTQSYGVGSIAYVENSYARPFGIPVAKLLNSAGFFVAPAADAVSIALLGARTDKSPTSPGYRGPILDGVYDNPDPRSYPLSAYSLMIVPTTTSSVFTTGHGASLGTFVSHLLCAGQQAASALGNAALPITLAAEGLEVLAAIPGAAETAITACANPTFVAGDTPSDNALLRRAPAPAACDGPGGGQCLTGSYPLMPAAFGLRATTMAALDGLLGLSLPDGDAALFDDPRIVDGVSVTTGVIGTVRVRDDRVVSRPGWDLIANLTDFVNDGDASLRIGSAQVGIAPTLVSSAGADIDLAVPQRAGSAVYPAAFASATPRHGVGDTVLGGVLTLVSPAGRPAGTYSAILTLTVTSR